MFPYISRTQRRDTEKFLSDLTSSWMRGRKQSVRFWFSRRRRTLPDSKVSWVRARRNWFESTNMFWCLNGERQPSVISEIPCLDFIARNGGNKYHNKRPILFYNSFDYGTILYSRAEIGQFPRKS